MPTSLLMPSGQDIGVLPIPPELTVAQASKILDMTEACVNELLDAGSIESRWKYNERLVQQDSLLAFDSKYREGCAVLAELAQLAQEMGMYDD